MTEIGHVTDSLRDIGLGIERLLVPLQRANTSVEKCAAIFHESERFRLWALNLGLCATGHASLFYRLRGADTVRTVIKSLLQDFKSMLVEVSRRLNIEVPADELCAIAPELLEGSLDMEDECGDDYANEDEDEVQLCIQEAADILDRLFRIASKIRSPATRTVSSKALKFQLPDSVTGVDLFDQYAKFDQGHVQEMFRHNGVDLNAINVTYLVDRMSRAITTRRRILAHGKRHRSKVAYAAQANPTQPNVGPRQNEQGDVTHLARLAVSAAGLSNPTTATFLDPNKAILDAKSNVSESVYAPTARGTDNEAVEVPPPPDIGNDRYFECPYCFFLCSKEYTRDKLWRNHVLHDLRPYVCTYPNCVEGDTLFDSRQDWINHENSSHRSTWRCIHHVNETFEDAISYRQHLEKHHKMANEDPSIEVLVRAGISSLTQCDRPCPFCYTQYENINDMHLHVAYHLERLSIFALPKSHHLEKGEDTDDGEAASNNALQRNESLGGEDSAEKSSLAFESQPSRTESLAAHSMTPEEPRTGTQQQGGFPAVIQRVASPLYSPPPLDADGYFDLPSLRADSGGAGEKRGQMLYDFTARDNSEVTMATGDEVIILDDHTSEEWWMIRVAKNGKEGFVPSSYVELSAISANEPPSRTDINASKPTKPKPDPKKLRTWTDRSGSFRVEAQLIGLADGKIHLHKQNGVKIAVPTTKIAIEDLEFVEKITGVSLDDDKPLESIGRKLPRESEQPQPSKAGASIGLPKLPEYDWFESREKSECFVEGIAVLLHEEKLFMRAILDTGIDDNFISEGKALETGFEIEPYTGPDIIGGNGATLRPVGCIDLQFHFQKVQAAKSWRLRFLVVSNDPPFNVVLGRNFIFKAKLLVRPNEAVPMEYKTTE